MDRGRARSSGRVDSESNSVLDGNKLPDDGNQSSANSIVKVENLSKSYGDTDVFENLNFEIYSGEIFCLLGPSGCGKTTLLHIIAGLEDQTSGEAFFNGEKITNPDHKRGVVFQDPLLYPWLNMYENIRMGPEIRGEEIDEKKIENLIDMIGLEEFKESYPKELSGGMAQRVSLARTLANDPDLLLLDEPTSALDALTQRDLQEELVRIIDSLDITAIYVTHDVEEAVYLGDRVAVMSDRPSRIKGIRDISLSNRDRESEELVEERRKILDLLEAENNESESEIKSIK